MKKNHNSLIVTGLGDTSALLKLRSNVLLHRLLQLCSILKRNNSVIYFSDARSKKFSKRELLENVRLKQYDVVIFDVQWYNCYETINIYNKIGTNALCYFFFDDSIAGKILAKEGISDEYIINWNQKSFKIGDVLMNNVFQQPICHTLKDNKEFFKSVTNYDIDIDRDLLPNITSDIEFVVQNGIKWINFNIDEKLVSSDFLKLNNMIDESISEFIVSFSLPYKDITCLVDSTEKFALTRKLKKISIKVKFGEINHFIKLIHEKDTIHFFNKFDNVEIILMMGKDSYEPLCYDRVKTLVNLLNNSLIICPDYSIDYEVDEIDELNDEVKLNILKGFPIGNNGPFSIPEIKKIEYQLNALFYSEYSKQIKKLCAVERWKLAKLANYGLFTQMYYYFCLKTNIEALRIKSNLQKKLKNTWVLTDNQIMNSVPIIVGSVMCASGKYYMYINQTFFGIPCIEFSNIDKKIYDLTRSGYTVKEIISKINTDELKTSICDYTVSFLKKLEQYDSAIFYVDGFLYDDLF